MRVAGPRHSSSIFAKDPGRRFNGDAEWETWTDDAAAETALENILLDFTCSTYVAPAGKGTVYGLDAFILMVSIVVPMVLPRESRLDFELTSRGERGPLAPAETERATTEDGQTRFTIYYRVDVAPQGQFFHFKAVLDLHGDGRHLIPGRRTGDAMQPEPKSVTLHAELPRGPY